LEAIDPATAVKVDEAEFAGMATEAGTDKTAWFEERATETPFAGAGPESVTVQSALVFAVRLVGEQLSDESDGRAGGTPREIVALCMEPLRDAVMAAV
jgi:hypothetical protein